MPASHYSVKSISCISAVQPLGLEPTSPALQHISWTEKYNSKSDPPMSFALLWHSHVVKQDRDEYDVAVDRRGMLLAWCVLVTQVQQRAEC